MGAPPQVVRLVFVIGTVWSLAASSVGPMVVDPGVAKRLAMLTGRTIAPHADAGDTQALGRENLSAREEGAKQT
jgi:hypothetical protein